MKNDNDFAHSNLSADPELLRFSESCVLHFPAVMQILPGQTHPHIFLAQAMFQALHAEFPGFSPAPVSGCLDSVTSDNLRMLQSCACIPESGELDKRTWNRLNRLYRAVFDRNHPPSYG